MWVFNAHSALTLRTSPFSRKVHERPSEVRTPTPSARVPGVSDLNGIENRPLNCRLHSGHGGRKRRPLYLPYECEIEPVTQALLQHVMASPHLLLARYYLHVLWCSCGEQCTPVPELSQAMQVARNSVFEDQTRAHRSVRYA